MTAPKKKTTKKVVKEEPVIEVFTSELVDDDPGPTTEDLFDPEFEKETWETPAGNVTVEAKEQDPPAEPEEVIALADVEPEVTTVPLAALNQGMTHGYTQVLGLKDVQEALAEDGYYGGLIHGSADHATRYAFAQFQEANGYFGDGIPTAKQLEELGFKVQL